MNAADPSTIVKRVPDGVKCDVYFVVDNNENNKQLASGQKRVFFATMVVLGSIPVVPTRLLWVTVQRNCMRRMVLFLTANVSVQSEPATVHKITRYYYKLTHWLKNRPDVTSSLGSAKIGMAHFTC